MISLLFHHVFEDEREIALNQVQPQERITLEQFRQIFEYFRNVGYEFVAPDQVEQGLDPSGKYLLVTFDDGYYNNLRLLPLMEAYQVPITIFLATRFLRESSAFWWDVQFRSRLAQNWSEMQAYAEQEKLMRMPPLVRDDRITELFGKGAWNAIDDLDRPMSEVEVREALKHPLINIGNHTLDHSFLSALEDELVMSQFVESQKAIASMVGSCPSAVSYPYGSYSASVTAHARAAGFGIGITCIPVKNYFSNGVLKSDMLALGRNTIRGDMDVIAQCEMVRSDVSLFKAYMARKKARILSP